MALARFPRQRVAGLTGRDWLDFLAAHGGGPEFTAPEAVSLVRSPYAPRIGVDEAQCIIGLCERWIYAGLTGAGDGPWRVRERLTKLGAGTESAAGTPC